MDRRVTVANTQSGKSKASPRRSYQAILETEDFLFTSLFIIWYRVIEGVSMKIILTFLVVVFSSYGCTYKTELRVSPATNIYSTYESKIPGKVALIVDKGAAGASANVKPSSFVCSAHKISVDAGQPVVDSIKKTTESMFESVEDTDKLPSVEEMKAKGISGYVLVKINRFEPRVSYGMGLFTSSVTASAGLDLDVTVSNSLNKILLSTKVSGERTKDGDGGGACEGGARVLSEAISAATRETMERYAERVANSQKIREEFK